MKIVSERYLRLHYTIVAMSGYLLEHKFQRTVRDQIRSDQITSQQNRAVKCSFEVGDFIQYVQGPEHSLPSLSAPLVSLIQHD